LTPSELNGVRTAAPARTSNDPLTPGDSTANPILSPSQLGFSGFTNIFGGNKVETAPFNGEPTRDTLTQPPPGYQTPSPNFAYGTGPKESLNKEYNPAAGNYGEELSRSRRVVKTGGLGPVCGAVHLDPNATD